MINLDHPQLLDLFKEHIDPKRSESASFLIWYLENYYRLETAEAVDAVCDQKGDKGVDGLFVNDEDQTITIFQSRIYQSGDKTMGDGALKSFAGTLTQFKNAEAIRSLTESAGNAEVAKLLKRLKIESTVGTHEIRGEFLSNVDLDASGKSYLKLAPNIEFVGKSRLQNTYISDARTLPQAQSTVAFDIGGFQVTEYTVDANTKAVIAPVRALELVHLDGIDDQSLFDFNVRGPLGKTGVNKDIVASIIDVATHKLFPLFHNGITIISNVVTATKDSVSIGGQYYVVNGCQSLTALHANSGKLTDDLRILTKFIQLDPASDVAQTVTRYSNNQNGVKARDFKANHSIQIRLQNEFKKYYKGRYFYEIKRGELKDGGAALPNETAGLYMTAFDLKEPWATHRAYQVFDDKHSKVFGRPEVTADRIVLCQLIMEEIREAIKGVKHTLFAKHVITSYMLLYVVRQVIEQDDIGDDLLKNPGTFVRDAIDADRLRQCVRAVLQDVIIDLNAELEDVGDEFDYRDKLRDAEWVKTFTRQLAAEHLKMVTRKKIPSMKEDWIKYSDAK